MTKTWIVTGSSVGLGRQIVLAALAAGNNVVGTARNPRVLSEIAARFPTQFISAKLDVSDPDSAHQAVEVAVDCFGRVDVLVSNAGFSGVGSIEDMPIELVEEQFSTNFMGALNTSRAVLPTMRYNGSGRIILVSSIGARIATAGAGIYYASKAAVSSLAETLAVEVRPMGIYVTAVEPGAMRTRFTEAESQKVSKYDPQYEATVGSTIKMMKSPEYTAFVSDPQGHANLIVELAGLPEPPVRLLAGIDAFEIGRNADDARTISDLRWEKLSRSATIN